MAIVSGQGADYIQSQETRFGARKGAAKALIMDKTAILDAIEEVLTDREGITTASEARLALLVHAERPWLGGKDHCDCGEQDTCDECMTEVEAVAYCRKLASSDQQPTTEQPLQFPADCGI